MYTALIADDEPVLVDFLQAELAALWPELTVVAAASNGVDALRLIGELAPSVVFLDIRMPGLTGLEVAQRLQAFNAVPHVVFVTAHDQYAVDASSARRWIICSSHRRASACAVLWTGSSGNWRRRTVRVPPPRYWPGWKPRSHRQWPLVRWRGSWLRTATKRA
jgi:CheY-like chemotaxis protein